MRLVNRFLLCSAFFSAISQASAKVTLSLVSAASRTLDGSIADLVEDIQDTAVGSNVTMPLPLHEVPWVAVAECEAVCSSPSAAMDLDWEASDEECLEGWPYVHVVDASAELGGHSYHIASLPCFLEVRPSRIPDAGLGVFASMAMDEGVVFGPYQGEVWNYTVAPKNSGAYCWELNEAADGLCVDGTDKRRGNWLRYVNSARWDEEQNLIVVVRERLVFYAVIRPIWPGEELLIWYGAGYDLPSAAPRDPDKDQGLAPKRLLPGRI